MQESTLGDAPKRTAYIIPVRLETVYARNAVLEQWLLDTHTRPISLYLLIKPTPEELKIIGFRPQAIISRLRDSYERTGVVFSVLSERHGRMLICVSSPKRTTESVANTPSSPGLEPSSSAVQPSGQAPSQNGTNQTQDEDSQEKPQWPGGIDDLWPIS